MAIERLARGKIKHLFFFPDIARIELVPLGSSTIRNFLIYDDTSIEIVAPLHIAKRNWLLAALNRAFFDELVIDVWGEDPGGTDIPTMQGVQFYSPSLQPGSDTGLIDPDIGPVIPDRPGGPGVHPLGFGGQ